MCCWALETWPQAIPRAACLAGKNFSNFSQANTASGPSPKNRGSGIHAKNLEDWGGTWKNKTTSKQRGACGLCHLPWYHGSKHVCSDLIKLVDGADPCWLADQYLATVSQERHKLFKAAQIIRPVDKWQQGEKGSCTLVKGERDLLRPEAPQYSHGGKQTQVYSHLLQRSFLKTENKRRGTYYKLPWGGNWPVFEASGIWDLWD